MAKYKGEPTLLNVAIDHGSAGTVLALARCHVRAVLGGVQRQHGMAVLVVSREFSGGCIDGEMGGVGWKALHMTAGLVVGVGPRFEGESQREERGGSKERDECQGELDHLWLV